ncbi:nuclear transport factor 2 family protein [Pseudonocardia sp. GCM10023141]|uniref:nuclear transport factor 2 family protein n=1 Tax=Pseudonocardia sp. GCM10023141 TaxID=3252653 RepID=UPI003611531D
MSTTTVADTDRRFFDALIAADPATLDEVLDPEFLIVDVNAGAVTPRAEFVAFVASGAVRFTAIETFPGEAVTRQFGDTTVVVGRTAMEFTLPDGAQVRTGSRYTHVFVADGAGWRLASAQGTALA